MKRIIEKYVFLLGSLLLIVACSTMDEYKKFENGKEVIYIGKADSVKVHEGRDRIAISMLLADPKASRIKVYWHNMADSMEVSITNNIGVDTINVVIPHLPAGDYNFVIYVLDVNGNKSIPIYLSGRSYDDVFEKALVNRPILKSYRWSNQKPMFILWDKLDTTGASKYIGAKITYQDDVGNKYSQLISFNSSNDTTMLILPGNVSSTQLIEYSSMIKPGVLALDTFYAPKEKINYSIVPINGVGATDEVSGIINVTGGKATIDKVAFTFTQIINIKRILLDLNLGYSTDLELSTTGLPAGTNALNLGDVTLKSVSGAPVTKITVSPGQEYFQLVFTLPKSVIDNNPGKKMAFNINLSNLVTSKFNISGLFYTATFVVNVSEFKREDDMTKTYFKNPGGALTPFERSDAGSTRFGNLKNWIVNAAVLNMDGSTHGGFDSYGGGKAMSMERWGSPQILNGKIYQTFILPAGKYRFEVNFTDFYFNSAAGNGIYLVVDDNNTIPDVSNLASSVAYVSRTTNGRATLDFNVATEGTFSIGVLGNMINDGQAFRANEVKLLKYVNAFD